MTLIDVLNGCDTLTPTELERVVEHIKMLRETRARKKLWTIRPGDTVTFAAHIRPTYLAGLTATVVDINRTTVAVACPAHDVRYGRFAGCGRVRLPVGLVA
jgi:hypothetical protein